MHLETLVRRTGRQTKAGLKIAGLAACCLVLLWSATDSRGQSSGSARAADGTIRVADATLAESAAELGKRLNVKVEITLPPAHPARKKRISLSMAAEERNDALNAVAAAYGLRWIEGPADGSIRLVDKRAYRSDPAGLRQAVADAVPEELRLALLSPREKRQRAIEGLLKELPSGALNRLESKTAKEAVPLQELDADLARPLSNFLQSYAAFQLGLACDQYYTQMRSQSEVLVHYGPNDDGFKCFQFRRGNRWLSVAPE